MNNVLFLKKYLSKINNFYKTRFSCWELAIMTIIVFVITNHTVQDEYFENTDFISHIFKIHVHEAYGKIYDNHKSFEIIFPSKWKILDNQEIILISPDSINSKTGGTKLGKSRVMMTLQIITNDNFNGMNEFENSFVNNNCKILSNELVKINNIATKKMFKICEDDEQILVYIFSTNKEVIFVGFKGSAKDFNRYLDDFMHSLNTIKLKNQVDESRFM